MSASGDGESAVSTIEWPLRDPCGNCEHAVFWHEFDDEGEYHGGARCHHGDAVVFHGVTVVEAEEPCPCTGLARAVPEASDSGGAGTGTSRPSGGAGQ